MRVKEVACLRPFICSDLLHMYTEIEARNDATGFCTGGRVVYLWGRFPFSMGWGRSQMLLLTARPSKVKVQSKMVARGTDIVPHLVITVIQGYKVEECYVCSLFTRLREGHGGHRQFQSCSKMSFCKSDPPTSSRHVYFCAGLRRSREYYCGD